MPPARLQLQLTRAGPSHHEPRLTQLELALGAMHMARPGARHASHERAGPRAGANQQQGQLQTNAPWARHQPGQDDTTAKGEQNQASWSLTRFRVYRHGACSENDLNAKENERACPTRKKRTDEDEMRTKR